MKRILNNIIFSLIGAIIGGGIMLYLSERASFVYLDALKIHYEYAEELAGREAIKNEQYFMAIHHFKNLSDSSTKPTIKAFQTGKEIWHPTFPFTAGILRKIQENSDPNGLGALRVNGINRGLLAYAFEKYGMYDEAEREWKESTKLLGTNETLKTKEIIEKILEI
ncbi:MAG: hypothetical protein GY730_09335 [bacterium]|nr:hypothetical protein [bacterium]